MARDIFTDKQLIDRIPVIGESEENKYSDIPGWEGGYMSDSPSAVLLYFPKEQHTRREQWFPLSQLRIAEDRQSIYASNRILERKGLG